MISCGDLQGAEKLENLKSNVTNTTKSHVRHFESFGVSDSTAKGCSPWERQVMHVSVNVLMRESSSENKLDLGLVL